ncbi:MAG: nitroreductase family protein, partial [Anaerolineaceae bacterium]
LSLLKAGTAAPSACNNKPWEFVAVDDPAVMEQFHTRMKFGPYNAPAAIAVCYNPQVGGRAACNAFWQQDCAAATENILIAAVGLGLGTVWLGAYPADDAAAVVKEILHLPEEVIPMCLIYVGYPAEEKEPRTQYDEKIIHWQRYGGK